MPKDKLIKKRSPSSLDKESAEGDSGSETRRKKGGGFLAGETTAMEERRRLFEQAGLRAYGDVHVRLKSQRDLGQTPENVEGMKTHPLLDSQRFDGIDPSVTPYPINSIEAQEEYKKKQLQKQHEQKLRLGLAYERKTAPRFTPPG